MKLKNNKLLLIIASFTLFMLFSTTNVHAVLQSNGDQAATKNIDGWMLGIRQMQASGGTLGLTDTINSTGLTSNNTNLDIHMQKNTEYGAMILLSASSYGNPNPIADGGTTTGNASGIVMKINKEWVAAGAGISNTTTYRNSLPRYKNAYSLTYGAKDGDAILNWHESTSNQWLNDGPSAGLLRSYSGSVFSYYGYGWAEGWNPDAKYRNEWYSRAAIVVGAGI